MLHTIDIVCCMHAKLLHALLPATSLPVPARHVSIVGVIAAVALFQRLTAALDLGTLQDSLGRLWQQPALTPQQHSRHRPGLAGLFDTVKPWHGCASPTHLCMLSVVVTHVVSAVWMPCTAGKVSCPACWGCESQCAEQACRSDACVWLLVGVSGRSHGGHCVALLSVSAG